MTAIALTIAGSDSGGGGGIQADLETFSALCVYGVSVVTAITAQNTLGVSGVEDVSVAMTAAQMEAVFAHLCVNVVKIGMRFLCWPWHEDRIWKAPHTPLFWMVVKTPI